MSYHKMKVYIETFHLQKKIVKKQKNVFVLVKF